MKWLDGKVHSYSIVMQPPEFNTIAYGVVVYMTEELGSFVGQVFCPGCWEISFMDYLASK